MRDRETSFRHHAGAHVGPWTLIKGLGVGGNAEVWLAERPGSDGCALKILRSRDPNSEPFLRFRDEIAILAELGDLPGILRMLDHYLPPQPSKTSLAWLALPVAEPIVHALGPRPSVEGVVAAMATIAGTLGRLADSGVHHRDVKPENLYSLDGSWLVGDFGLAKYPSKRAFTTGERAPGAFHYLAPECWTNPHAPAGPADVYALAKTLWVLASAQRVPLQGHLNAFQEPLRLGAYATHPRIRQIELLIDRATHPEAERRPTMSQVASELSAWCNPRGVRPAPVDTAALANRAAAVVEAHQSVSALRKARMDRAIELCLRADAVLRATILPTLAQVGLEGRSGGTSLRNRVSEIVALRAQSGVIYSCHPTCSVETRAMRAAKQPLIALIGTLEIVVSEDGQTTMLAVWAQGETEGEPLTLWAKTRSAPTMSAEEDMELVILLEEVSAHLSDAACKYVDWLQELLDEGEGEGSRPGVA